MELSKKERLMLINQYRILSILNPDGAASYNVRIKMLENGYSLHYDEMVSWLDDGMSREECQEVIDILEMYRCLWQSFRKLKDKKGIRKNDVRFPGFDAKDEEKQLNYAEFVMYSLKRYREFHQRRRLPNHDSYRPMLGQYRAMISVWRSLGCRKLLTKDEIIQILSGERSVGSLVDDDTYEKESFAKPGTVDQTIAFNDEEAMAYVEDDCLYGSDEELAQADEEAGENETGASGDDKITYDDRMNAADS